MNNVFVLIVGIVVLAGVGYVLIQNTNTEPTDTTENETSSQMEEKQQESNETEAQNEQPEATEEASEGTDAGMEFPTIETSGDADVSAGGGTKVFEISGWNFEYDVKEIRVKEGDSVTITFTSIDGFHDWTIDGFNTATNRVQTDDTASVTFVADKAGTYEYYCSVGQHRAKGMVGTLVVE